MKHKKKKIKRYGSSFNARKKPGLTAGKVVQILFIGLCFVALGWFLAVAGMKLLPNVTGDKTPQNKPASQSPTSAVSSSFPETSSVSPPVEAGKYWVRIQNHQINTLENAIETAEILAQNGVEYGVITVKDNQGQLHYPSASLQGYSLGSQILENLPQIVKEFNKQNITLVASIASFKDPIAPYFSNDMAVGFKGEPGILWLDDALEFGGKPWLNPYSPAAFEYISFVIQEVMELGFTNIVIENLQFPTTPGIEKADFYGSDFPQDKAARLAEIAANWSDLVQKNNGVCWFSYSAQALLGHEIQQTGVSPLEFGVQNLIVTEYGIWQQGQTEGDTFFLQAGKAAQDKGQYTLVLDAPGLQEQQQTEGEPEHGEDIPFGYSGIFIEP